MKGRALQLGEKVMLSPSSNGELARAEVADGAARHTVTLSREGRHALAECDCERFTQGTFCRHIWATVLHLVQSDGQGETDLAELSKLRLRPPKARKRDKSHRPARREEPSWVGRLTLLRHSAVDRSAGSGASGGGGSPPILPVQRQVLFVVRPALSQRHNGLALELRQRTAIATGWSKPKALRIGADTLGTLSDATDREIASMLLGAAWVSDQEATSAHPATRSNATFLLPQGATRRLLKQMIATGRCYVDPSDDGRARLVPLRWDDGQAAGSRHEVSRPPGEQARKVERPWRLFLVGTEVEDQLRVDLQLRREVPGGDQTRMSVDKPALILGGPEGLVICDGKAALFDDRDAFRWVTQFRDERYEEQGTSAIHVAEADVPRFLDRLYMLPQLPELDLPDRWSRTEQRIEPTPHLELFSPGSAAQMELAPGAAKQHLVGRVWFDYAGTRIHPTQPGRFVPVAPAVPGEADGADHESVADTASEAVAPDDSPATGGAEMASPQRLLRRHRRMEREAVGVLGALGFRQTTSDSGDALVLPARLAPAAVGALLGRGWVIAADRQLVRSAGPPSLSITSGIDWFELHGGVRYKREDGTEQQVSLPDILKAARAGQSMITLDDGTQGLLPHEWLAEHGLLTTLGQVEDDHLRFHSTQAAVLDVMLEERELESVDAHFLEARQRLHQFDGIAPADPDPAFRGELRPYQREGLGWLAFLRWFGAGGILADDMGLGKTIQVLAMLQARKIKAKAENGEAAVLPSLIVVPRSLIFNWSDEAERFTPDLRVLAYTGPDRQQHQESFDDYDLIVTSYGLLRRDIDVLGDRRFNYVVLDEAQSIKNPQSQAAKAARLLRADHRLALTGTPIENHLGDLWSIFEFLNPGMLGANTRFGELVRAASTQESGAGQEDLSPPALENQPEGDGDEEDASSQGPSVIEQVAAALRPFVLRRTKHQVLKDLPPKTEQTIICEMDPPQRRVYDQLRTYYRGTLLSQLDREAGEASGSGSGMGRNAFMVLEALLRLRQAACHPALIDKSHQAGLDLPAPGSGAELPSAKLDVLDEQLAEIIDEGSKALVFSQFTSMLALVKQRLDRQGVRYAYLDGQTRDRREQVERFQTDPDLSVFLISLKAGGTGLNLTAAEYVFILDPWWNPAVEAQAIDRTHRIGQTKPVFAYRLICENTVEQRILALQKRKRKLADAIVGGDQDLLRNLTRDDLATLLS